MYGDVCESRYMIPDSLLFKCHSTVKSQDFKPLDDSKRAQPAHSHLKPGFTLLIILWRWSDDESHSTNFVIERVGERERSGVFFKHHLTVTALTDPYGWQTCCLYGGGPRMDGSTEVNRGHNATMEGDARQGGLKGHETKRRNMRIGGGRWQRHHFFRTYLV